MTNAEARQKKTDDRGIFAVRLKGGRLAQVLANALFGRCFPCQQALALFCSVVGGLSLAGCEKKRQLFEACCVSFFMSNLFN